MTHKILSMSAIDVSKMIRNGETTCSDVLETHLVQIDKTAYLNAVTTRYDDVARQAADDADQALKRGDTIGPLHGIPVTIKENIDQKGCSTNNGVKAFANVIASEDAPLVQRLKNAGAIPIGRTNTPEMSWRFHTDNVLFGQTLNPWNSKLTPGGSSGGAGSSLAAGVGYIAHGSDLAGSIRFPAYCCGVLGLRPSHGRIPFYNSTAVSERPMTIQLSSSQGPLARSVGDLKLAYEIMAGSSDLDSWSLPNFERHANSPVRVALITPPEAHPQINKAIETMGQVLARQGYIVETVSLDFIKEAFDRYMAILITEVFLQKELIVDKFGSEQLKAAYEYYAQIVPPLSHGEYAKSLASRSHYHRLIDQFQRKFPLILSPICTNHAFEAGADIKSVEHLKNLMQTMTYLGTMNFLDLPSMNVPTKGVLEGIPVGVQLIGPRYGEDLVLEAARVLEEQGALSSNLAMSPAENTL
ncbi:amidase [Pseudovibrio sp. Tun.PSC04-5.I4]|uniref:amidase n=1 Tax=Pseudovibrio sp. Tun.PSC04-5.I4 TaxID=1798213 RepID=UPI000891D962|nr:amidase [Pseudovibrio sp. Tun.PSC04-5.I4]SDQ96709.1 amidase [Pseudovibrio sp. Tun.PSC04-5.I4]